MHSIRAIATNTVKQILRMKIAAAFIVLLLVLLPVMGFVMTGDGTVKGRLQSFVSYGLSLTSFLLCLLTIAASTYSVTSDIEGRQIYTVITKPVRRYELLLGKLLGVILLDVVLLGLFCGVVYAITIYMPTLVGAGEEDLHIVRNEFFTARQGLVPSEPDVSGDVEETYKKLLESGQLPRNIEADRTARERITAELTYQKRLEKRAVPVGHGLVWNFENVRPADSDGSLFIRFKYDVSVNPPDLQVYGRWLVGDNRQYPPKVEIFDRKDLIRSFHELEVPAYLVAGDGYLAVEFVNVPLNSAIVIFPLEEGLEVLYKADDFTWNFIRACLLILFRLIFLACIGIFASSFVSFPVAVLLCLLVFFTGTISGWIIESFDLLENETGKIYLYTIKPLMQLLPQFDEYNPGKFLVPGRLLTWSLLARAASIMVCVKSALLLVLGLVIFHYREIAKITV